MGRSHRLIAALVLALAAACGPASDVSGDGGADGMLPPQPDADGDTISDDDEGRAQNVDTDGDGTPDWQDADSDGDGVDDVREAGDADTNTRPVDSDTDGTPDFRDFDADANGAPDGVDGTQDFDGDGIADFQDLDDDGDMLTDAVEIDDPASPIDSDGDGMPDYRDTDSDNDTIGDRHELALDPDTDGVPAYLDGDSDGDCRGDAAEAGDAELATAPVDSDGDNGPDFVDLDSDNDGLLDQLEDVNCNGVLDAGESDPGSEDTDLDGTTDLVEVAAGTDPTDPGDNPQANGDFVFEVPYNMPPNPTQDTLDFSTDIVQADVVFAMDTTGSMGGEINNLKTSITNIINTIAMDIPDAAFGVTGYDDFPCCTPGDPYGVAGDQPFYLLHRVMTVSTPAGLASVQNRVNAYATHNGADGPESGWEAMHQLATGAGVSVGNASVPMFNPATAYPSPAPAGETVGTIGGAGFRVGSLPIVVWITDYDNHNGVGGNNYSFAGASNYAAATTELVGISARVIAVISQGGNPGPAKTDALYAVNATGAVVPPSAWGPVGTRPAGCAVTQCCTGIGGAGVGTDGAGMCPLAFDVDASGSGLGSSIITAIEVLTTYGVIDIGASITDDPSDAVDAVQAFVQALQANPTAPAPCASGLTAVDTNGDGILDTFPNVNPGTIVCFDVIPKMNTTVMPTTMPQMFRATITVTGDGVTTLDTRDVYFLVPPEIPDPPVM